MLMFVCISCDLSHIFGILPFLLIFVLICLPQYLNIQFWIHSSKLPQRIAAIDSGWHIGVVSAHFQRWKMLKKKKVIRSSLGAGYLSADLLCCFSPFVQGQLLPVSCFLRASYGWPEQLQFQSLFVFLLCVRSTPCTFYSWWFHRKTMVSWVFVECQLQWIKFKELMLNAVALNAILDVDEFLGISNVDEVFGDDTVEVWYWGLRSVALVIINPDLLLPSSSHKAFQVD